MIESKSIWVVDDDPVFRMIFKMTVKKLFSEITIVEHQNGEDACDAFQLGYENRQTLPAYLFMDINMPEMNGWDCLDKIEELVQDQLEDMPKIFIVSSSINSEDRKRAFDYSFTTDYLTKPISVKKFEEILRKK